jgi:hypothetical protein
MMYTLHRTIARVLLLIFLTGLSACSEDDTKTKRKKRKTATNSDAEEIEIKALRFEKDFFSCTRENFSRDTIMLRKKYGLFLDRYCADIIQVGTNPLNCDNILSFTNYPNFKKVSLEVERQYKDVSFIEEELQLAFTLFSDEFPDTLVPKVITMISGFNYSQANTDSVLAISLEMYLGERCSFYESLNYPEYKKKRTNKNYLVPDAMRGFLTSTFSSENKYNDLISNMIYDGKILYMLKCFLPDRKEHEYIGYTEKQWEHNEENEANIWAHFIDKKLFYSKDFNDQVNYLNDGPFTPGFSKETPPKMGAWLGYKIVSSYMEKNPNTSLEQLIYLKDAHQIFQKSGYKPPRQ